jgi:hypothetical protein
MVFVERMVFTLPSMLSPTVDSFVFAEVVSSRNDGLDAGFNEKGRDETV